MSAFTLGGELVHYEVLGRGRQVIFVHGWIGSWRYWIPTLQYLQAKYRVYALDLFGFGDSGKNPDRYSLEHQVELLADFQRELGVPKAAFVGHGLGALVVLEYTRRYPQNIARVMLVSLPLFDTGDLDRRVPVRPQAAMGRALAAGSPLTAPTVPSASSAALREALLEAARARTDPTAATLARPPAPIEPAPAEQRPQNPLQALITDAESMLAKAFKRSEPEYDKLNIDVLKTDGRAIRESVATYDAGRVLDTLRLLTIPAVVLHGLDDPIIQPPSDAVWNYITADKENLLAVQLPNVRHFPMLEYDLYASLLNDFLDAPDVSRLEIKERWRRRTR